MAATLTCAHCGSDLASGDRYCPQCGAESLACAACTRPLLATDLSCPHCGTPTSSTVLMDLFAGSGEDVSPMADILERLRRATLGEFEIGRELGRGGMAAVFLAHEIALDREVAIKVMAPGLLLGEGMVERFRHEAITIAHLHHPNIVSVYSVRHAEGLHYFIMRYVPGRSLEQVLQRAGPLPLATVRSILFQVGSALQYAHRSRIIHRDIKPANILIDLDGNAIVTDFGIAKAATRPSHTLTGALVGTPAYMSPEQCSGLEVSEASDQYALGAVAYELVTGAPPFSGSTLTVMQSHVERAPAPISVARQDCPPELEAAILRMLAKDPAERWPRLADALAALGAAALEEEAPELIELIGHVTAAGGASPMDAPPTSPAPRTRASQPGTAGGRPIGGIAIMPAPAGLETGDSFTLVAVIRGEHGTRLPPRAVEWTTDAPEVLRIDPAAGVATALTAGTAMVTATCKGISALLKVEVASARADDIVIEPMNEPLYAGEEIRLEATPHDKRGWPVYRGVTWQSADPSVAAVTPHGTIAGRAPGTVRMTAALDDARASIVIPVLPPRVAAVDIADPPTVVSVGESVTLTATALDGANAPLPGRAIQWSSSDVRVAVVTGDGHVAALAPGSATLTATCEGVRASVRIGVSPVLPVPTLEPTLRPPPRRRSRRAQRRALLLGMALLAAGGVWFGLRPREERTTPPASRTITGPAAYAGSPPGVDTAVPAPTVTIAPRPNRALRPDAVLRLTAEVRNAAGAAIGGATVTWSSTDSTVARVDGAGRVRALQPGRTQIVAQSGPGRDSVVITVRRPGVRAPTVTAVAIDRQSLHPVRAGHEIQLHAVALGPQGDTLSGAEITWASSNPQVASVDALTGVARGLVAGRALMLATSGNRSSVAELTVLPNALATLQVLGARPMAVQETLGLRVVGRDPAGEEVTGIPITWASSDSAVAAVDEGTGTVVGIAPGSATITATAEDVSARVRLTVLPRPQPLRAQASASDRAADWMAIGLDECYGAVQSQNVYRLRTLWQPQSPTDEENLKGLSRILSSNGWAAIVGQRVDRPPVIGPEAATMDFTVPLTWREPDKGTRAVQLPFRAEFVRAAGRWEMSSCRIVGPARF